MGREIKRVPANFDWPLNKVWKGFINPYYSCCDACPECGRYNSYTRRTERGDGLTPAAREIADGFYDFGWEGPYPSPNRWADKLTQEEVNLLVDEHRLHDFRPWLRKYDDEGNFLEWERRLNDDGTPFYPTAEAVNAWERSRGMGHDALNRWILIEHRWKKAGLTEDLTKCHLCKGEGNLWPDPQDKIRYENFAADNPDPSLGEAWSEPPEGEWWQVWETVSEGSPVTPAFETPEELIDYLVENGDGGYGPAPSREAASRFVLGSGWVPSGMVGPNGMITGVQQSEHLSKDAS